MKFNVFEFNNYKAIMKRYLREKNRGALSRAAEAMGCQRSYLSRVMNSKMQLTPDQAYALVLHLKMAPEERKYFQMLVEYERASQKSYKEHLALELKELKNKYQSISEVVKRPHITANVEATYFSAWYWSAIHFLTSSSDYQSLGNLVEKLNLPTNQVQHCLSQLKDWGLIKFNNQRYEYSGGEFHLPKGSPFVSMHHHNWRARAIIDSQNPVSENIHYTNIQTASREDIEKLKLFALEFIKECNQRLGPSKPEDAVAITLDIFNV